MEQTAVEQREMSRDEWLAERRLGIGGSDAAAVCGLSPWRSRVQVYLDKLGLVEDTEETERMRWGNLLEDVIAREYAEREGVKVQRRRQSIAHPEHHWMRANIDRAIVGQASGVGILECKNVDRFAAKEFGEAGTDAVPEYYLLQVVHYMAVTGYGWGRLAALIGGNELRVYEIPRDDELIGNLIEVERRFWEDHVLARLAPEPTSAEDVSLLYPQDNGRPMLATAEAIAACKKLVYVKDLIKRLSETQDACELTIKRTIGPNANMLVGDDGKTLLSWKSQSRKGIDTDRLRKDHPAIAAEYAKSSTFRVLRTTKEIHLL